MRKIKVSASIIILVILCFVFNKFLLVFNYLLALLLHELAHVFVAESKGYKLKQFRFSIFGFSVEFNEKVEEKDAFLINLAGPLCNVIICVLCLGAFWLFENCYFALKTFCLCNFVLATFNLLPIYPLDGGKLFRNLIKDDKSYKVLSLLIKWCAFGVFMLAFIVGAVCGKVNFYFLLFAIFFLLNREDESATFSLLKTRKEKRVLKIKLLKIDDDLTLFDAVKKVKHGVYTMFYVRGQVGRFVDEDKLIEMCLKNNLTKKFCEIEY